MVNVVLQSAGRKRRGLPLALIGGSLLHLRHVICRLVYRSSMWFIDIEREREAEDEIISKHSLYVYIYI